MKNKKDLPLTILKALEPFVKLKGDKFEVIDPKDYFLHVVDKDHSSNFEFVIEQFRLSKQKGTYEVLVRRTPRSLNDTGEYHHWFDVNAFHDQFNKWIELLQEYDNTASFYDDPILKSFEDEFYADFELIDDEANANPFTIQQILHLDAYLENLQLRLLDFDEGSDNLSEIKIIASEITLLQDGLTKSSREWVFKRLIKIWGKIAKQGPKYIREFLTEAKKEVTKELVKGIIKYVAENVIN